MISIKQLIVRTHWFLSSQLGIDFLRFLRSLCGIPAFISDWRQFRRTYHANTLLKPCLHDRYDDAGATRSEYFWQDLLVARWIFEASREKHVDVGSRLDGFVAHVASFREVEVLDVGPISQSLPGVVFRQADLMNAASSKLPHGYCDSLSCLHALEHFGLGRYGDPIDPFCHEKGIANMAVLLKAGGTFYLSCPIGRERVEFNAHRVFDPHTILRLAEGSGLALTSFKVIKPGSGPVERESDKLTLAELAQQQYNLGVFVFKKQRA